MVKKYRSKPVIKEAIQFKDMETYLEICDFAKSRGVDIYKIFSYTTNFMHIKTLEGTMTAYAGDYIICGLKGEFYPCKSDIFEASYELVEQKGD